MDSLAAVHDPPDSNVGVVLGTLVLVDGGVAEGVAEAAKDVVVVVAERDATAVRTKQGRAKWRRKLAWW
jgi:hypothetical protein